MNYFKATFNGAPCVLIFSEGWYSISGSTFANKLPDNESVRHGTEVLNLGSVDLAHSGERLYSKEQLASFIAVHHAANDLENNAISESTFDAALERYRQANARIIKPVIEQAKIIKRRYDSRPDRVAVITLYYNTLASSLAYRYQYHFDDKKRVRIGNTIKDSDIFYRVVIGIYHFDTRKLELHPRSTQV